MCGVVYETAVPDGWLHHGRILLDGSDDERESNPDSSDDDSSDEEMEPCTDGSTSEDEGDELCNFRTATRAACGLRTLK